MGTKYYVSEEALELKGMDYFKSLSHYYIIRHANKCVDGIYYERDDMYNYKLCANIEDETFTLFDEDEDYLKKVKQ